jgi:hypothetical protein
VCVDKSTEYFLGIPIHPKITSVKIQSTAPHKQIAGSSKNILVAEDIKQQNAQIVTFSEKGRGN